MGFIAFVSSIVLGCTAHAAMDPDLYSIMDRAPRVQTDQCKSRYQLLTQNGAELRILIAYGYSDVESPKLDGIWTNDSIEKDRLVYTLTAPCNSDNIELCGFHQLSPNRLVKTNTNQSLTTTVYLDILDSSYSINDRDNRQQFLSEQKIKSQETTASFVRAFQKYDVILYSGHSRNGGGPDFSPPRMNGSHVDYGWYEANRPGVKLLTQALKSPHRTQILGLFSCASKGHFGGTLQNLDKKLALFLSLKVSEAEFLNADLWLSLNGLLTQRCSQDINQDLKKMNPNQPVQLYNF